MRQRLTTAQAAAFGARVLPMPRFLGAWRRRLDEIHFDRPSKLYQDVERAYDAIHSLRVELHYQSVRSGVRQPPKKE
jgi:hypothetical protein